MFACYPLPNENDKDASRVFFVALGSLPAAVALLTALRWLDGVTCPHYGSAHVGGHERYRRCRELPRYRCQAKPCPPVSTGKVEQNSTERMEGEGSRFPEPRQ
jgi:hypothetical protein